MLEKNCPLCKKHIYSGIGKGCKLCGMLIENNDEEFCSKNCKIKYREVRGNINKGR